MYWKNAAMLLTSDMYNKNMFRFVIHTCITKFIINHVYSGKVNNQFKTSQMHCGTIVKSIRFSAFTFQGIYILCFYSKASQAAGA